MKKLVIVLAAILVSVSMATAQSGTSYSLSSSIPGVSSSIYSTPKVSNYNTTCKSVSSYLTNQTYQTPNSYTTVNTTRTSLSNNSYISGTDVFSNGSLRSSSITTSIDFGGSKMTTTNIFDKNGNLKSSRIKNKIIGW